MFEGRQNACQASNVLSFGAAKAGSTRKNQYSRGSVVMSAAAGESEFSVSGGQVRVDPSYQDQQFGQGYNE